MRWVHPAEFETSQRLLATCTKLEWLRRDHFSSCSGRLRVAGSRIGVCVTLTVDLLAVAVANGGDQRDGRRIWGTSIKPDVQREAAAQLAWPGSGLWNGRGRRCSAGQAGRRNLACSGGDSGPQRCLSHRDVPWPIGSPVAGVAEPDLAVLQQQAPLLVAQAAGGGQASCRVAPVATSTTS